MRGLWARFSIERENIRQGVSVCVCVCACVRVCVCACQNTTFPCIDAARGSAGQAARPNDPDCHVQEFLGTCQSVIDLVLVV